MKIERLSPDKIRIFLTFDDLVDRGIQKDDIWREIPKVHELFSDMMEQAYSELGFDANGPLAVEVFALPAQGMVIIVTRGKKQISFNGSDDSGFDADEDVYEMEVTLEQSDLISYSFTDFEHVIRASKLAGRFVSEGGTLFSYRDQYVLQLEPLDLSDEDYQSLISVLSEFGEASSVTSAMLTEYGKLIIADDAIGKLEQYFH
jgi:adapter protein MecA 1/2